MKNIDIIYRDSYIIGVNKPAGVPTQRDKTGIPDLMVRLRKQVGKEVYLVHRLDVPVSGVVVFAFTKEVQAQLSLAFRSGEISKKYFAISRYLPEEKSGTLQGFIQKNSRLKKAFVSREEDKGTPVKMDFRLIANSTNLFLFELQPKSGKFHQIRAQLSAIGCPIRGDVKYGDKRSNKSPGINLHAYRLSFQHPVTGSILSLEAPVPEWPEWNAFERALRDSFSMNIS